MGGHGGLNILPQKSWNVYNFDNREKVKKDEEEAARKEAIEKQQARQRDAEFRLERLREAAQARNIGPRSSKELRISNGEGEERSPLEHAIEQNGRERLFGSSSTAERPQHFNLFEGVEIVEDHVLSSSRVQSGKERREDTREGRDRDERGSDKKDSKGKKGEAKVVEPQDAGYEFGFGLVGKSGKRPWYSTKGFMVDRTGNTVAGTQESGSRSPVEGKPRKRRKTQEEKLERRLKKKEEKAGTSRKTVEVLRAERLKREQQERDKARKLVVAQRRVGSYGVNGFDRPGRPYYNQSFGNAQ